MSNPAEMVKRFLDAWNETDAEARRAAVSGLWAEDGRYVDPLVSVEGQDALCEVMGAAQQQVPGHVFRLLDGVDAHHNVARFRWEVLPAGGGDPFAIGYDVAVTEDDGRIGSVVGFLDKAPASL